MYAHTAYNGYLALRKSVLHSVCYLLNASHTTVTTVKACTCPVRCESERARGRGSGQEVGGQMMQSASARGRGSARDSL
jgi:hypothetical protein